jgi:putative spermidine/putrescine transport system ATP-binding protein
MTYLGDSMHFAVQTPWEQELAVRMAVRDGQGLCIGSSAVLEWDTQHGHVFA